MGRFLPFLVEAAVAAVAAAAIAAWSFTLNIKSFGVPFDEVVFSGLPRLVGEGLGLVRPFEDPAPPDELLGAVFTAFENIMSTSPEVM